MSIGDIAKTGELLFRAEINMAMVVFFRTKETKRRFNCDIYNSERARQNEQERFISLGRNDNNKRDINLS